MTVLGKLLADTDETGNVNAEASKTFVILHEELCSREISARLSPLVPTFIDALLKFMRTNFPNDISHGLQVFARACEYEDQLFLDGHLDEVLSLLFALLVPENNMPYEVCGAVSFTLKSLMETDMIVDNAEWLLKLLNNVKTVFTSCPQRVGERLNFLYSEALVGQLDAEVPSGPVRVCYDVISSLTFVSTEKFDVLNTFMNSCLSHEDSMEIRMGCFMLACLASPFEDSLRPLLGQLVPRLEALAGPDTPELVRESALFALTNLLESIYDTKRYHITLLPVLCSCLEDKNVYIQAEACRAASELVSMLPKATVRPYFQRLLLLLGNGLACPNPIVVSCALNAVGALACSAEDEFLPYTEVL
jgi:hypothetical protein